MRRFRQSDIGKYLVIQRVYSRDNYSRPMIIRSVLSREDVSRIFKNYAHTIESSDLFTHTRFDYIVEKITAQMVDFDTSLSLFEKGESLKGDEYPSSLSL